MRDHIVNQITKPHLVQDTTLHVIGVISNTSRYHSRYRLYRRWAEHMEGLPHVKAYTVEAAFGDRHHEVTEVGHLRHHQVRTRSEIWCKESLINLGVRHLLPTSWRYVAWVDCDVEFRDPSWALETMHQLQHFAVVQPWQNALDLGPHGNVMQTFSSFGYRYQQGGQMQAKATDPYPYGHCGFAWACTRAFWEAAGGLVDHAILGSADHHMAWACVGKVEQTIYGGISVGYGRRLREWQARASRASRGEVGYVPGRIEHSFHGAKRKRGYQTRWQILLRHGYDPDRDLVHDEQGLVQLVGKHGLEREIAKYNLSRHEDSIDED